MLAPHTIHLESQAKWCRPETQRLAGDNVKWGTHPQEKSSLMEHWLPRPSGAFSGPPIRSQTFQLLRLYTPGPVGEQVWSGWIILRWQSPAIANRELTYWGECPCPEEAAAEQWKHGEQFHRECPRGNLGDSAWNVLWCQVHTQCALLVQSLRRSPWQRAWGLVATISLTSGTLIHALSKYWAPLYTGHREWDPTTQPSPRSLLGKEIITEGPFDRYQPQALELKSYRWKLAMVKNFVKLVPAWPRVELLTLICIRITWEALKTIKDQATPRTNKLESPGKVSVISIF